MINTAARTWSIEKPVRDTYLIFGSPEIAQPEIDEVVATLRSGWIGTGPRVARFEEEFRLYVGAGHALAVNSCTAGLHLALIAIDLRPGDEVMDQKQMFKQIFDFNKAAFDNSFNAMVMLQEQTEKMASAMLEQATGCPQKDAR